MQKTGFSEKAQELSRAAGIECLDSIIDVNPAQLAMNDIEFMITDYDGVLARYGEAPEEQITEKILQINQALDKGLAVVSNNPFLSRAHVPEDIAMYNPSLRHLLYVKPLPFSIRAALVDHDADPARTLAVGDGCTDILAGKQAGIGRTAIVTSLGGHKAQDRVHASIYGPIGVPVAFGGLQTARKINRLRPKLTKR